MQIDTQTPDCVSQAVLDGERAGHDAAPASDAVRKKAREIAKTGPLSDHPDRALDTLLSLISEHPGDVELQLSAGDFIERRRDYAQARAVWTGIKKRHRLADRAFLFMVRWAVRDGGDGAGRLLLDNEFPEAPSSYADRLTYARCLVELKDFTAAEQAFEDLLRDKPADPAVSRHLAELLLRRGEARKALAIVQAVPTKARAKGRLAELERQMSQMVGAISLLSPHIRREYPNTHEAAIAALFEANREARRRKMRSTGFLGRMAMVSGSLGMGGAERQFTVTAAGLKDAIDRGAQVGDARLVGPLDIYVRSLKSRANADFFLPRFDQAGLTVRQLSDIAPLAARYDGLFASPAEQFVSLLPRDAAFGLERIVDQWLLDALDLVSIWQDGMVLNVTLAAIAAQIPRIAVHMRGMPPNLRPNRAKAEYRPLYRLLSKEPGVVMISNSRSGAEAYEDWLDLDRGHIHTIYNGVEQPVAEPDPGHQEQWDRFAARTADTPLTIGTVFRFDANKRPVDMVKLFHSVSAADLPVRLVMVGDGSLRAAAQDMARDLGVADRVLFVPQANGLGFWLEKFDLLCLISRSEGVPNSLIEAQMCGVPVATTQAGGALEAIKPGVTGLSLGAADNPDWRAMRDTLITLLSDESTRKAMGRAGRIWSSESFSTKTMLRKTVNSFIQSP